MPIGLYDLIMSSPAWPRRFREQSARSPLGWVPQAGTQRSPGLSPTRWRTYGSYATVYLIEGRGTYSDARGISQPVSAGDLILVFPDVPHRYVADGTWLEIYLVFEGPAFDLWRSTGLLDDRHPVRRLPSPTYWRRRFESVLEEGATTPASSLREVVRLQTVMAEALHAEHAEAAEEAWLSEARRLLADDAAAALPLPDVARRLRMTYATLRRRFTAATGMSPGRYRTAAVIDRASRLMATTDLPHKAIAHELGFCDEFHFSKRFKSVTGRTPTQFRAALPKGPP